MEEAIQTSLTKNAKPQIKITNDGDSTFVRQLYSNQVTDASTDEYFNTFTASILLEGNFCSLDTSKFRYKLIWGSNEYQIDASNTTFKATAVL